MDALDECDDGAEFLKRIAPALPYQFKLLVTSRTPETSRKDLASQKCEREVLWSLCSLPEGLTNTYGRILRQANALFASRRLLSHIILFWNLTVRRTVSVSEMRMLLAVQPTCPTFDERRLIPDADCDLWILALTHGLLQLRGPENRIYFAHFSVTGYLREYLLHSSVREEILDHYNTSSLPNERHIGCGGLYAIFISQFLRNLSANEGH